VRCPRCGRVQAPDFILCPYCGHGSVGALAPPESEDFGQGSKIVLYLLSLIVPIVGIIFGLVFMTNPKPEYKHVGRVMILLGIVPSLVSVALALIIYLLLI
jgi:hypothetical protein